MTLWLSVLSIIDLQNLVLFLLSWSVPQSLHLLYRPSVWHEHYDLAEFLTILGCVFSWIRGAHRCLGGRAWEGGGGGEGVCGLSRLDYPMPTHSRSTEEGEERAMCSFHKGRMPYTGLMWGSEWPSRKSPKELSVMQSAGKWVWGQLPRNLCLGFITTVTFAAP